MKNKDASVSTLNYLNNASTARSIDSFDFKKLYTNLPHIKVIDNVADLLKRCFEIKKLNIINITTKFKASWSDKKKQEWSFGCDDIIDIFKFLINNIYVKFRGIIYRQVIGIRHPDGV